MVIFPAVSAVISATKILFATLPVKPVTLTRSPAAKPAVTKPEPLSLKLLSDVSALIVPALIVTAGDQQSGNRRVGH
jgi:hypothetical protein